MIEVRQCGPEKGEIREAPPVLMLTRAIYCQWSEGVAQPRWAATLMPLNVAFRNSPPQQSRALKRTDPLSEPLRGTGGRKIP